MERTVQVGRCIYWLALNLFSNPGWSLILSRCLFTHTHSEELSEKPDEIPCRSNESKKKLGTRAKKPVQSELTPVFLA